MQFGGCSGVRTDVHVFIAKIDGHHEFPRGGSQLEITARWADSRTAFGKSYRGTTLGLAPGNVARPSQIRRRILASVFLAGNDARVEIGRLASR
jgi:hypothetical protein